VPIRLGDLARQFDCQLVGDADVEIETVGTIANADARALSFIASDSYREQLPLTKAGAVILREELVPEAPCPALVDSNPYAMYARMAAIICPPPTHAPGVHDSAVVADSASVADSAHVAANAVIEDGSVIGRNSYIGPGAVIGPNCELGDDCRVLANVTLVRQVTAGDRCIFHPGSVIGSDGFGNAMTPEGWVKVPQVGGVRIGSDVEIGANTTIDCGAVEDTVIGNGVRIDNLVQVAHNCHIGDHTAMAAGVGISGSTRIGRRCMFAGHSGTVGHIDVCDDVTVLGQGVLSKDITEPGVYAGTFVAEKAQTWNRRVASLRRLDKLQSRVRALEKKVQ
jgi:UDP-3-O-[3-hydroxymyristoyl] glucosamine N-acyltransferase